MNAPIPDVFSLDYQPCRYGEARLAFRGPAKTVKGNYVAFLGGTETFGPCIETPFADLVELQTGLTCINLGCQNGGIDNYLSAPGLVDLCTHARVTVIQVMGAQNMSNRFYSVDPRRNNRFIRASKLLKSIAFEVDFGRIGTTAHLLTVLARESPDSLPFLRQELQTAWVARMRSLIRAIGGTTVLLWAADHAPRAPGSGGTSCREPLFVNRAMLDAVMIQADHLVEVIAAPDEVAAGEPLMRIGRHDAETAVETLGPVAHRRIAAALAPVLTALTGTDGEDDLAAEGDAAVVNLFACGAKD